MSKKMIVFDIDGTLVDNTNHCIWPSTIECLKKLKENGHELVIASGRHYPLITNIEILKPMINHYILINGQQIRSNGKIVYSDTFDVKKLEKLLKDFDDNNIAYGCVSSDGVYVNKRNKDVDHAYVLFGLDLPEVDKDYHLKEDIYQIWCFGHNEEISEFSKTHEDFRFISWGEYGFDCLPKGRSKAITLKILANMLGYEMSGVIAIGDGLNDIEMISEVGIGIAMGNANDILKEKADIVTDTIDNDGLYKAFKDLKLL